MNNKNLLIILGVVVVLLVLTLVFSGGHFTMGEGEDPALALAKSQAGRQSAASVGTETAPAEEKAAEAKPAEATSAGGTEAAEAETGGEAAKANEGEAANGETAAEATPAAGSEEQAATEAAGETTPEPGEAADKTEDNGSGEGEQTGSDESGTERAAQEIAGQKKQESGDEDLMDQEALPEDPVERFKQMDPRDIIDAKYKDLEDRETHPWDEDNPEVFIPETGRVDPLTRVSSAVPDDLKPPRSGETDQNLLQTYLGTAAATDAVNAVALNLYCLNVIQIGLERRATFSFPPLYGDRTFTIQEGGGFGLTINGVSVNISVSSIDTDTVVVRISGSVPGTSGTVNKTQTFIPRAFYH